MIFAKPQRPERGTKSCREHMAKVAQQPCVVCGSWPVVVHHVCMDRFSRSRASDYETIPLCWKHHDAQSPEGLHAGAASWRDLHGPDWGYLAMVRATMRINDERTV